MGPIFGVGWGDGRLPVCVRNANKHPLAFFSPHTPRCHTTIGAVPGSPGGVVSTRSLLLNRHLPDRRRLGLSLRRISLAGDGSR